MAPIVTDTQKSIQENQSTRAELLRKRRSRDLGQCASPDVLPSFSPGLKQSRLYNTAGSAKSKMYYLRAPSRMTAATEAFKINTETSLTKSASCRALHLKNLEPKNGRFRVRGASTKSVVDLVRT
jgi:hypothetical protein